MTNENEGIDKCIQHPTCAGIILLGLSLPLTGRTIIVKIKVGFVVMAEEGYNTYSTVID